MRFRRYQDKAKIWGKIRGRPPIKYEGVDLQIFTDLAPETLARRRLLKPLLEQMWAQNLKYNWGFPACLIGQKDGRSTTLRFPEDLQEFCNKPLYTSISNPRMVRRRKYALAGRWTLVKALQRVKGETWIKGKGRE